MITNLADILLPKKTTATTKKTYLCISILLLFKKKMDKCIKEKKKNQKIEKNLFFLLCQTVTHTLLRATTYLQLCKTTFCLNKRNEE